ncbi:MAG TPA: type II secretion system secretin GspD [Deltaproteobacteria bacterium]|nr:type II secretion system secretin GspD [Deltaproteobacteria bacterium]HQI00520.1 type II secretion system secretin GspD [Deltaproteobacteria bacterium]
MNIRNMLVTIVIALLLSSSGVWGARLINSSQAPAAGQQDTQPKKQNQAQKPAGADRNYRNVLQEKNIQPGSPGTGESLNARSYPKPSSPRGLPSASGPKSMPESPAPQLSDAGRDNVSKDKNGKQYVTMDFDGVDIKVFVKFIADITGKNFILDDKVAGKVTVISPRKMTLDEAYQVFLSVLDVNGFGTVNMGGVIKVVQAADAVTRSLSTSMKPPKKKEDSLVTQIVQLKHADANDMKTLFTPLLTRGSSQLLAYPQSNVLIITDTRSNIRKMLEILGYIDVTGFGSDFRIFPLAHASATDLGTKLTDILSEGGAGSDRIQRVRNIGQRGGMTERGKTKIIPYERTNALIVLASPSDMSQIESLVKKLDIPTPTGKEDIHVYYLQFARAEDVAKVLTDVPTPVKSDSIPPAQQQEAVQRGLRSAVNNDRVKISPDKETNSLVIYADPDAYQSILDTIKYLDIPRKQVYVKAMIMEVNQNKDFTVGVQWNYFEDFTYDNGERVGGVFGRTGERFITSPADIPSGAAFGVVGQGITITQGNNTITFPNMTSFISAMAHDNDVRILATPQIITMDNKEAEITVGSNVPYLTRESTDTTNLNNTVRTFDYRDVGVTLRLTPLINQQGNIRLELFQENTSLVEGTGNQEFAPTTLKRTAKTTVTVKDGATMVIGGLIGDTITNGESGVPLLRNIPILGHLFKTNTNKKQKTNLFIFLTPRVIDTDVKTTDLYKEKYGEIDAVMNPPKNKKGKAKANENTKP